MSHREPLVFFNAALPKIFIYTLIDAVICLFHVLCTGPKVFLLMHSY